MPKYHYDRTARAVSSEKLLKDMKEAAESLLEPRVAIRTVHEQLSDVSNDASGVSWTDNYHDADIDRVAKMLYELDHKFGEARDAITSLAKKLKAKAK